MLYPDLAKNNINICFNLLIFSFSLARDENKAEINKIRYQYMCKGFPSVGVILILLFIFQQNNIIAQSAGDLPFKLVPEGLKYLKQGDSISVSSTVESSVFLVKFKDNFMPAAPPMIENPYYGDAEMQVDSVLNIAVETSFSPIKTGLYFAQNDTSTVKGAGFLVVGKDYPKYKKLKHLVSPLIYISTEEEMQTFEYTSDLKRSFNNYWLNLAGSRENASRLIKIYFKRVTVANNRFTSYKEGWKTDAGIVYVVFGEPDQVTLTTNGEKWIYRENVNHPATEFEFVMQENMFVKGKFRKLVRNNKLKGNWYETVERWRSGIIKN